MDPKLAVFLVVSVGIAYVSRGSLRAPRSHGFPRFFAWEAIAALVIRNFDHWFEEPFSARQLASWCLLTASGYLVVAGAIMLRTLGKPRSGSRPDAALYGVEQTTRLVTQGVYRRIRHPLYGSLLCLAWGVYLKEPAAAGVALALAASIALTATARIEEAENIRTFGQEYREYMKRSRMFIPYLF